MYRSVCAAIVLVALALLTVAPASAAEPVVTKRVVAEDDGAAVLVVEVRAADQAIYGVVLADESASVADIVAPKGWAGISSGDRVVFTTVDTPVKAGERAVFRMVTTNKSASLAVTFRDAKRMPVHAKQTI
jgi:hypothetical protein